MPTIGQPMQNFELPNQDGVCIRLSDYRGQRLVLFAFPTADKPTCTQHACTYRDTYTQFEAQNTVILGITGTPANALRKWRAHHNFPYDLLSDMDGVVLDQLGAWGQYVINGIDLNFARRSYWIIDEGGIIRQAHIDVDVENSVYESLEFLKTLA